MPVTSLMDCMCCRFVLAPSVDVYIRSEGCNDPLKTPNTCGIAYIRVNGKDHSRRRRGHNVVVLDEATGKINCATDFIVFLTRTKTGGILNYEASFVLRTVLPLLRSKLSLL